MDDYLSVALSSPLATIIIGLLIEYGVVQPIKARLSTNTQPHLPGSLNATGVVPNTTPTLIHSTPSSSAAYPYYYVIVGIVAALMGAVAALIIPVVLDTLTMGAICLLPVGIIGSIGGAILALGADGFFKMHQYAFYKRFPLAVILGFVGGWLGIIALVVYFTIKAEKIGLGGISEDSPVLPGQQQGQASTIEACGYCKGKGKVFFEQCPACGGKGSLRVCAPARICVSCKGKGKNFLQERCMVCKGTGWAFLCRDEDS